LGRKDIFVLYGAIIPNPAGRYARTRPLRLPGNTCAKDTIFSCRVRNDGLIVLAIFQKVRAGIIERSFPERIIVETIEQGLRGTRYQASARGEETQKYDETIHRLLRHFIDKNVGRENISAEHVCRRLLRRCWSAKCIRQSILSQIQKTFNDLVMLLGLKTSRTIEDFRHWYHTQFFKHKADISAQLRALQAQIEDTVEQLNDLVKNKYDNFREMLIGCEALLDRIKEQADKLSSAFLSKDDIKQLLDDADLGVEFLSSAEK
jgi:hypothetical protein